jgi:hypothetical protein
MGITRRSPQGSFLGARSLPLTARGRSNASARHSQRELERLALSMPSHDRPCPTAQRIVALLLSRLGEIPDPFRSVGVGSTRTCLKRVLPPFRKEYA